MKKHTRSPLALFAAVVACTFGSDLHAADITWLSPISGYWSDSMKWSPAYPPILAGDNAYFLTNGTYTAALDYGVAINNVVIGDDGGSANPAVTINTSSFTLSGQSLVSYADILTHVGMGTGGLSFSSITVNNLVASGRILGDVRINGGLSLTGNLTIGNASSDSGLIVTPSSAALHYIGAHSLTILSADRVDMNHSSSMALFEGGSINAANGVAMSQVVGHGSINGETYISLLDVSNGDFTVGDAAATYGAVVETINYYASGGTVTLRSAGRSLVGEVNFMGSGTQTLRATNGLEFIGGVLGGTGIIEGHALFQEIDPELTAGSLVDYANLRFEDGITIAGRLFSQGSVISSSEVIDVTSTGSLSAESSTINGRISGSGVISSVDSAFGDASSTAGFDYDGQLYIGGLVDLLDANEAELGTVTTLNGGNSTLRAENGIRLAAGREIRGSGLVFGSISGDDPAGAIAATEAAVYTKNIDAGSLAITMVSSETASLSARLTLNGNTATSVHGLRLASTGSITGHGIFDGDLLGLAGSSINVAGGSMTLGKANSYTGFSTAGTIQVGTGTLNLRSAGFATLGSLTRLEGGTLQAANGIYIGGGNNLVGSGTVSAKVAAGVGSTISASGGDLTLGNANAVDGFYSDGVLKTGNHQVTILDRNQAVLGSLTELGNNNGGGKLVALNGLLLQTGRNLVGYGDVTGVFTNQGDVEGVGPAPGDGLVFHSLVKGSGSFSGNIAFGGGYAPGNSPAIISMGNTSFLSSNLLTMEIGGLTPGPGTPTDNGYDKLLFGSNTVTWGGTLEIVFINGFTPELGQNFDIFDFEVANSSGTFNFDLFISEGLHWDISQLYTTGTITVIPEPSSCALLVGCGWMALAWMRRRSA